MNLYKLAPNLPHMPSPNLIHSAEPGQGLGSAPAGFAACAFWVIAANFALSYESCMHLFF